VHKLEALYMQVRNVLLHAQAQLHNIFLVALWYAQDVKNYGYSKILRPIDEDLKRLASDEGLCIGNSALHVT
jgi:hypothetical protein